MAISRRDFMKYAGMAVAGLGSIAGATPEQEKKSSRDTGNIGGFYRTRAGVGCEVDIGNMRVHVAVGEYANRPPRESVAEIFVNSEQAGSSLNAVYSMWAKESSRSIRMHPNGMNEFLKRNLGSTGPVQGITNHPHIKTCYSVPDFIARLIRLEYLGDLSVAQAKIPEKDLRNLRFNAIRNRV